VSYICSSTDTLDFWQNVSMEEGSMIEPLSVGVHSVAAVGALRSGKNVAVFGWVAHCTCVTTTAYMCS
jgi:threonine dehydrogenase-like Zn-dependent dehydrogenase